MASLVENLIDVLDKENSEYKILLDLSLKKTPIIVRGDHQELTKITDEEQRVVSRINLMSTQRQEIMNDIANVLNKDVEQLKLKGLIEILGQRPKEQQLLAKAYDELSNTVHHVARVNDQNRELIKNALEMVEFDMNLFQSMKMAPETANYNRGAYNTGSIMGTPSSEFDAKQ